MSKRNPEFSLRSSRRKVKETIMLRQITLGEAKNLGYGDRVYTLDRNGNAAEIRVSSKVKTWKRDPNRIEVSFKYGMYENFRMDTAGILRDIWLPGKELRDY
jgi:hypothetical protein